MVQNNFQTDKTKAQACLNGQLAAPPL